MTNLYRMLETNTDETKSCEIQNIELLFNLKGDYFEIQSSELAKNIICVSGSCDLQIEKNQEIDTITLNHPSVTIYLEQNTIASLKKYTNDTKVIIEYLRGNNEL